MTRRLPSRAGRALRTVAELDRARQIGSAEENFGRILTADGLNNVAVGSEADSPDITYGVSRLRG